MAESSKKDAWIWASRLMSESRRDIVDVRDFVTRILPKGMGAEDRRSH